MNDPHRDMEQAFKDSQPIALRFLSGLWNAQMSILKTVGLMPVLKKSPWLLLGFFVVVSCVIPPLTILFALSGIAALNAGVAPEDEYIIKSRTSEADEEERLREEVMLGAYFKEGLSAEDSIALANKTVEHYSQSKQSHQVDYEVEKKERDNTSTGSRRGRDRKPHRDK